MAVGRDATDVAITTTFGSARLVQFDVVTDEDSERELYIALVRSGMPASSDSRSGVRDLRVRG